jgi:hypothetical protein
MGLTDFNLYSPHLGLVRGVREGDARAELGEQQAGQRGAGSQLQHTSRAIARLGGGSGMGLLGRGLGFGKIRPGGGGGGGSGDAEVARAVPPQVPRKDDRGGPSVQAVIRLQHLEREREGVRDVKRRYRLVAWFLANCFEV